jgi:hypothetical protein
MDYSPLCFDECKGFRRFQPFSKLQWLAWWGISPAGFVAPVFCSISQIRSNGVTPIALGIRLPDLRRSTRSSGKLAGIPRSKRKLQKKSPGRLCPATDRGWRGGIAKV